MVSVQIGHGKQLAMLQVICLTMDLHNLVRFSLIVCDVCVCVCVCVGFEAKVGYGLLVVGSDGVLTEHYLQPYKAPSANEGDDAPIGLQHSIKRCWKFLRYMKEQLCTKPFLTQLLYEDHIELSGIKI